MKLLQLERLVADMRAAAGDANPNVTFYKYRQPRVDGEAQLLESTAFVEWDIDSKLLSRPNETIAEYRVCRLNPDACAELGDFNLPLVRIPFLKEM